MKQSAAETCSTSLSIQQIVTPLPKFDHPLLPGNVIKYIPRPARPDCAAQLTTAINNVIADPNSESAWSCLLHFGKAILLVPHRAGRRHNLSNILKRRSVKDVPELPRINMQSNFRPHQDDTSQLAASVRGKLEEGNFKAAVRIICSEEKPTP
jgi:hypothetical protein